MNYYCTPKSPSLSKLSDLVTHKLPPGLTILLTVIQSSLSTGYLEDVCATVKGIEEVRTHGEQQEVKEAHNLIHWEANFRMRAASCPWTLTKGVLSLSYPKENLIRQFLLEGKSQWTLLGTG